MFTKSISSTPLTGGAADRLFSNITALDTPDLSFLATLRALLRKRLPRHETVHLSCAEMYSSLNEMIFPYTAGYNIMLIRTENQMFETIRTKAGSGKRYLSRYSLRDDLRIFYARKLNTLFYTDDTGYNTIIFTNSLELKYFHTLQMTLPRYLPLLFENDPLTPLEIELLKSLGNKSAVDYETLLVEFAKDLDIRSELIRTKLAGFEAMFERIRIDELKVEISGYQRDYESYLSYLRDLTLNIQECNYKLAGLECAVKDSSSDSELMEYFMCNKNLILVNAVGTSLEFIVHGYADVYDSDAFEKYVGNRNGFMYNNLSREVTKMQMEKLYRAIFGERRYRLRLCAAYKADFKMGLSAVSHYIFPDESKTYLPNPHIQTYRCVGSYAGRFQEYMRNKDYVGAIDQAVVSARNLNFYDSTVMTEFANKLSCSKSKCIEKNNAS